MSRHFLQTEVVVDSGLVTRRRPDDPDTFCAKRVEEVAAGPHRRQRA